MDRLASLRFRMIIRPATGNVVDSRTSPEGSGTLLTSVMVTVVVRPLKELVKLPGPVKAGVNGSVKRKPWELVVAIQHGPKEVEKRGVVHPAELPLILKSVIGPRPDVAKVNVVTSETVSSKLGKSNVT